MNILSENVLSVVAKTALSKLITNNIGACFSSVVKNLCKNNAYLTQCVSEISDTPIDERSAEFLPDISESKNPIAKAILDILKNVVLSLGVSVFTVILTLVILSVYFTVTGVMKAYDLLNNLSIHHHEASLNEE